MISSIMDCTDAGRDIEASTNTYEPSHRLRMLGTAFFVFVALSLMLAAVCLHASSSVSQFLSQLIIHNSGCDGSGITCCLSSSNLSYDRVVDILRMLTFASSCIAFFWPLNNAKQKSKHRIIFESIVLVSIPILVHLAGTALISNIGGMGSE